jgi:hypothetical protein
MDGSGVSWNPGVARMPLFSFYLVDLELFIIFAVHQRRFLLCGEFVSYI